MSNLKSVLKCWSEFNLPNLQKSLDQTANEIVARQENAEKGKKALIKLTKEWKASASEETRSQASLLIKAFQKEIDALNKRSKATEGSFLQLYKNLLEIPDPVPVLKQSEIVKKQLDKAKDWELENQELRKTLEEYNSEFADVKNQEITIQKLKEKLKGFEENAEEKLKSLLVEKEKKLQITFDEREQKLVDSKLTLATKLGDTEAQIKALNTDLNKYREDIFDIKTRNEEEQSARLSEIQILESELDRANQQLLVAEKFSENFKTQFTQEIKSNENEEFTSAESEVDKEIVRALEFQLLAKERELSDLMEEVHHQQNIAEKNKKMTQREIASLEASLERKTKRVDQLTESLNAQQDYEEIKRELQVLKMIEFSEIKEDNQNVGKPLEKLLLEKNKSLQSECTNYKVKFTDLKGKFDETEKECARYRRTIEEQGELITQLEGDVMNVRATSVRGEGVGAPSAPSAEAMSKAVQHLHTVEEFDKQSAESLLPIVSSQRERFRNKNLELETQMRSQHRQITTLQTEVDTIRQDNVKLYEKIKFLQSYPNNKNSSSVQIEDDPVKRYSESYEQRIDPFNVFSRKEKQQRYTNLSTPEKITLNMGRFILSNKLARTLVFFYTLILHSLVFLVLYYHGHTESCNYDMRSPVLAQQTFGNAAPQVSQSVT